ncbi:multidrug ABC transporter permease, partial [Lactobacillus sp. XV13L]|nr:multidrug ABC transporter permease [Lactobacillus sp. XV13L]
MTHRAPQNGNKTVKLRDFLRLLSSLNVRKSLFIVGLLFSLITSGANLALPLLTRNLVDTSKWDDFNYANLLIIVVVFAVQLLLG